MRGMIERNFRATDRSAHYEHDSQKGRFKPHKARRKIGRQNQRNPGRLQEEAKHSEAASQNHPRRRKPVQHESNNIGAIHVCKKN